MAIVQDSDNSLQVLQNKGRNLSPPQLGSLYDQLPLTPEPYVRESNRSSVRHPLSSHCMPTRNQLSQPELVNYIAHRMKIGSR